MSAPHDTRARGGDRGEPLWLAALLAWSVGVALARARAAEAPRRPPDRARGAAGVIDGPPRELRRLPGIGEARAIAIARERWARRGDGRLDLDDVHGVGPLTVERIEAWIRAEAGGE